MTHITPDSITTASFRDPAGSVFKLRDRIFRVVNQSGVEDLVAFLNAPSAQAQVASGQIIGTHPLAGSQLDELLAEPAVRDLFDSRSGQRLVEHDVVEFPSYPYEWPPEMLHAAATLTLDLAETIIRDGLGLKDGTPYNILFRGPDPVFIDVLSFERRDPGDATWLPYAQFVRTFLLPLLANQCFGVAIDQILTTRRDGLEPEEVYRWTKLSQRLQPKFLSLVCIPTWLSRKHDADDHTIYRRNTLENHEKARFILDSLFGRLRRTLARLKPRSGKVSRWSDYLTVNNNYTAELFDSKQRFVQEVVSEFRPRFALDIGCNTGFFSRILAQSGASVVALDYDPVVVGEVWRMARDQKLSILPLVLNLTRPTPGIGWRNKECLSFLDRARNRFDLVIMLAVIHHMLVTERVPLNDIIDLAAELTNRLLVIEFIAPSDSMFQRLTRGREELHKDLTREVFESACQRHFEIVRCQHTDGSARWLYLLRKR